MNVEITGIGYYLPEGIETSEQLALKIDKSLDWIISRTGVKERRISTIDVDQMGAIAARKALGNRIPDLIINASGVGKQVIPDTSVFYQKELGLDGIPCFSVHATCLSFLVALNTAATFINQNIYDKILIISSDRGTRGRNYKEPESAALLGDAAAAVFLEKTKNNSESKVLSYSMQTWSKGASYTEVRGGGTNLHSQDKDTTDNDNLFSMNGPLIYKMARKKVYKLIHSDLKKNNLDVSDIDCVVPHQASMLGVEAYHKYGGFDKDKVVNIIPTTGNCVAASLPLAFALACEENKIKKNDIVYLIGTGAGLSIASMILRY